MLDGVGVLSVGGSARQYSSCRVLNIVSIVGRAEELQCWRECWRCWRRRQGPVRVTMTVPACGDACTATHTCDTSVHNLCTKEKLYLSLALFAGVLQIFILYTHVENLIENKFLKINVIL